MALRIDLGSANLKGSSGFGKKENYTYDVPDGAIHVSLDAEDKSSDSLNIGSGNGKVTLKWDREGKKARVHAWVNGAVGSPNEVRWTVYAWIPDPSKKHKVQQLEQSVPTVSTPSSISPIPSGPSNSSTFTSQTSPEVPEQKFDLAEKRGLAILINCDYRATPKYCSLPGTEKDAKEMKETFEQFKYDIHQLPNEQATLSNIEELLKRLGEYLQRYNGAAKNHDGSTKVIVFAFSGHGSNPNLLITNDGQPLFLKDVMEPLVDPKICLVHDIPKLFMIDACRGSGELSTSDDGVGAVEGNYRLDFATLREQKAGADDDESVWMPVLARDLRRPMFKDRSYQGLVANVNRDVNVKFGQHPQSQDQLIVGELKLYYKAA